jgi:hypothetical protein
MFQPVQIPSSRSSAAGKSFSSESFGGLSTLGVIAPAIPAAAQESEICIPDEGSRDFRCIFLPAEGGRGQSVGLSQTSARTAKAGRLNAAAAGVSPDDLTITLYEAPGENSQRRTHDMDNSGTVERRRPVFRTLQAGRFCGPSDHRLQVGANLVIHLIARWKESRCFARPL